MGNLILHKNNVISHSTNECVDDWVRNPDWMDFPSTLNPLDEKVYLLVAVFEGESNVITLQVGYSTSALIDWGDNTSVTPTNGITETKSYTYSTISSSVSVYKDGRNYKQAMIEVSGVDIYTLDGSRGASFNTSQNNYLDIYGNLPNVSVFRFGLLLYCPLLERIRLLNHSSLNLDKAFQGTLSLKVLEVNINNMYGNLISAFGNTGLEKVGNIDWSLSNINSDTRFVFNRSLIKSVGDMILQGSSYAQFFNECHLLEEVGDIKFLNGNSVSAMFVNCYRLTKLGFIEIPSTLSDINSFFSNCYSIKDIIFIGDMSGITSTTNAFNNCRNLRKLIMPNITVGFTIANCQLGTQELDDLFTSLGTASGSHTIIVTGNPGAATCDTSIATGKGWTVTI